MDAETIIKGATAFCNEFELAVQPPKDGYVFTAQGDKGEVNISLAEDGSFEVVGPKPYKAGISKSIENGGEIKNGSAKLATRPHNGNLPANTGLSVDTIINYLCPDATEQEAFLFLQLCQSQKLNPFQREAYLIKYDKAKPATMVVGKDAFTRRAEEHPKFKGFNAGIVVLKGDALEYRDGTFWMSKAGETLVGGWADVYRSDRDHPVKAVVTREEYDTGRSNWQKMPATMIRKVALVQALREAFPSAFSGMYDASEMGVEADFEVVG